jgi:hypothetical protein
MDPLTFTETEARFRHSLEAMFCEPFQHQPDCHCQDLKTFYGSNIYKCGMPGCSWYRVGFDTKSKRDGHMQKHTRPFKCHSPECPFLHLGFAAKADLEVHLAQAHNLNLHPVPGAIQGGTNASSEEELKAILTDAVQENDLSMIRAEADAVRKFLLDLLLSAYKGRASDAMIKHLVGQVPPMMELDDDDLQVCAEIFRESAEHGNYDVFRPPCELFEQWRGSRHDLRLILSTLTQMGSTRRVDLLAQVLSRMRSKGSKFYSSDCFSLYSTIIPRKPDTEAEIMALECLQTLLPLLPSYQNTLIEAVGKGCCSVAIAEFLLANGAAVEGNRTGWHRPISYAAKQTSREAAEFMEFLVRRGADTSLRINGKPLSEYPGPKNIQNWIGITWEELVEQKPQLRWEPL